MVWGGEFGRLPTHQGSKGRDHNPHGFTVWLAGGGIKGGMSYGATDDFGYKAVEKKVHVHDLHATILHLMGLDHLKLTYRHLGQKGWLFISLTPRRMVANGVAANRATPVNATDWYRVPNAVAYFVSARRTGRAPALVTFLSPTATGTTDTVGKLARVLQGVG